MIFGAAAVGVAAWAWTDIDLSVEEDIFVDTVTINSSNLKNSLKMVHFFANNVNTSSSSRYLHSGENCCPISFSKNSGV